MILLKYISYLILYISIVMLMDTSSTLQASEQSDSGNFSGVLRIHPMNSRYFTDNTGKIIYLTGSHVWDNLQDWGGKTPDFNYTAYINFLKESHHNFIRLWKVGENTIKGSEPDTLITPMPWLRTGPGLAVDGNPRFDLTKLNLDYFNRLRARVVEAGEKGIYVSVMLFDGIFDWKTHPFNPTNNINGIDGKEDLFFTLADEKVLRLQKEYIRKVIDSINDLKNVLYEVGNEIDDYSIAWQYHVIDYIREYEKGKDKQHPIGMTAGGKDVTNDDLFSSPADWISPRREKNEDYCFDPPGATGKKVIISDTDHLWPSCLIEPTADWVWKSFLRGHNPILMDVLQNRAPGNKEKWNDPYRPGLLETRIAMGKSREYAERIDLENMVPLGKLSISKYCLANPGNEYLVYLPREPFSMRDRVHKFFGKNREVEIDLSGTAKTFKIEWYSTKSGETNDCGTITGGKRVWLKSPYSGEAILYLY